VNGIQEFCYFEERQTGNRNVNQRVYSERYPRTAKPVSKTITSTFFWGVAASDTSATFASATFAAALSGTATRHCFAPLNCHEDLYVTANRIV
jgi:hypothetical protein